MKVFLYFSSLIFKYSKKYYISYIILSPFSALVQAGGIVSIFPLITVVTQPDKIQQNIYFKEFYFLDYLSTNELTIQLSILFLIINTLGILLFFSTTILGEFLASHTSVKLKNELSEKILNSDIGISSERSDLMNYIFYEIGKFQGALSSILSFYQNIVSLLVYLLTVSFFEPRLFMLLSALFAAYVFLYLISKKPLQNFSLKESENSVKITQLTLHINLGLKDLLVLKIGRKLHAMLQKFHLANVIIEIKKKLIILYPRYIFEILLYFVFVFIIVNYSDNNFIQNNLGIFALVAIFIWKSIPLLFNIFRSFSVINSNISSYKKLVNFSFFKKNIRKRKNIYLKNFLNEINFKNVEFNYNLQKKFKFNFKIKKNQKILLRGDSGSGKTTLLNLMTGLLSPKKGEVLIDNKVISNKNLKTYIFGYVTQEIILFNGTLAENLMFGRKLDKKFLKEIKKVFNICGLNNLVKNFDEIFEKKIEFNSPELSGGQRQRIAIARILMLKPKILILDEATNALDKKSETDILKKISKYYPNITIIVVTHRDVNFKFNRTIYF